MQKEGKEGHLLTQQYRQRKSSTKMQPWKKGIDFPCARCAKYWGEVDMRSLLRVFQGRVTEISAISWCCTALSWGLPVGSAVQWIGKGWSIASGGSQSGDALPVLVPVWDYLQPSTANCDAGSSCSTKTFEAGARGSKMGMSFWGFPQ